MLSFTHQVPIPVPPAIRCVMAAQEAITQTALPVPLVSTH